MVWETFEKFAPFLGRTSRHVGLRAWRRDSEDLIDALTRAIRRRFDATDSERFDAGKAYLAPLRIRWRRYFGSRRFVDRRRSGNVGKFQSQRRGLSRHIVVD